MKIKTCNNCSKILKYRWQLKYCSNKCQFSTQYKKYINEWKSGNKNGNVGINTRNISKHLKRYLIEKYSENCSICG